METKIYRWDGVVIDTNTFPMPMIYIKTSEKILQKAKESNDAFLVSISGTNSEYDGHPCVATIANSGYFPNFRPNLFNKDDFLVLTLACGWLGYPKNNGVVKIEGVEDVKVEVKPFQAPKPIVPFSGKDPHPFKEAYKSSRAITKTLPKIVIIIIVAVVVGFLVKN
jgi:hypothetical protein